MERWWGIGHWVIFYAFLVFLTSGIEILVQSLSPSWHWGALIGDTGASVLAVGQTAFAWLTLGALLVLSLRRFRAGKRLHSRPEAWLITGLIAGIMLSHLLAMAARIALSPSALLEAFLPLTAYVSTFLATRAELVYEFSSTAHIVMMAVFLVWIPRGKHAHILAVFPNLYLTHPNYKNGRAILDEESPDIDVFSERYEAVLLANEADGNDDADNLPMLGAARLFDLNRKYLLDAYACTQCQRCTDVCPMVAAEIDDDIRGPMATMIDLRQMLEARKMGNDGLVPGVIAAAELWNCTQCGACDRACPTGVEHLARIVSMRQALVFDGDHPSGIDGVGQKLERSGNPWGYPKSDRKLWQTSLTPPQESQAEAKVRGIGSVRRIAIFAGCMAAYDPRAQKSLQNFTDWLQRQGFDVVPMVAEICCGEPLRKLGDEAGFQALAKENVEHLRALDADLIVSLCPHCVHTLRDRYVRFGQELGVMHALEFFVALWKAKQLQLKTIDAPSKIALHMPCGLSKQNDISDEIQAMLEALGYSLCDDAPADRSHCCGAGGGLFFIDTSQAISHMRSRECLVDAPDALASACPFCIQTLDDGCLQLRTATSEGAEKAHSPTSPTLINVVDILAKYADFNGFRESPRVHLSPKNH